MSNINFGSEVTRRSDTVLKKMSQLGCDEEDASKAIALP